MVTGIARFPSHPLVHSWLRPLRIAWVPGTLEPLVGRVADGLLACLRRHGHELQDRPTDDTDALLTSTGSEEVLPWRQALMFTAHRRFGLRRIPTVFTLTAMHPDRFAALMARFSTALAKEPPDPDDFRFPGLAPNAARVFLEQGHRGGAILALERLLQAQAKCLRIILTIGADKPVCAYHFDLVGASAQTLQQDPEAFAEDLALRIATAVSTREVNRHQVLPNPIPIATWQALSTPLAMREASRQLAARHFFTEMVRIADLVQVPAVGAAIASQYSEGCFATWEPALGGLVATITGSARPVDKGRLTDDDLAVIAGLRADGLGALVRHVEGKTNLPPSSEAVEMLLMDQGLPAVTIPGPDGQPLWVPVMRSKLHGHRGVRAYDPRRVEYTPVAAPFQHYPVSCGTEAQALAIREAFARSQALREPSDPRSVVFTILPGHGVVIVEKWVPGKAPFQAVWEAMDDGAIEIESLVPQGPFGFSPSPDGKCRLAREDDAP